MKQILFVAALILSAASFARTQMPAPVSEFLVTKAEYSKAHIGAPGAGTVSVDYSMSEVRLVVLSESNCTTGMVCTAQMPASLTVQLPIKSIETDSCGIQTIKAELDSRPADGYLQQLTVTDGQRGFEFALVDDEIARARRHRPGDARHFLFQKQLYIALRIDLRRDF